MIHDSEQAVSNVVHLKMCRCNRAPLRRNARNCHLCHVEANKKYRRSLRDQLKLLRSILSAARGGA